MCGAREVMMARTADGRALRMLTIIDEYARECLAILTDRRITSQDVIDELFYLFVSRGVPDTYSHPTMVLNSLPRQYVAG